MDDLSLNPYEVRQHTRRLGQAGETGSDHFRYITPDFLPTALGHRFSTKADAIAELIAQLHGHGQKLMRAACDQAEQLEHELDEIEAAEAASLERFMRTQHERWAL